MTEKANAEVLAPEQDKQEIAVSGEQDIGGPATILNVIAAAANNPEVDAEKMERFLSMQERILDRESEQEFNNAMTKMQTEMRPIAEDASNSQTRSKYASFLVLDKALRPIYTKNGFSLSFSTGDGAPEGSIRVFCYVGHEGGHTRTYQVDMPADGKGAKGGDVMSKTHAAGSAFTYGQRYLIRLIFNVAVGEDDDGNAAGGGNEPITEAQVEWINAALDKTNSDKAKFCKAFKADAIPGIKSGDFGRADSMLRQKAAKMEVELD